jgi:hypothetical protein
VSGAGAKAGRNEAAMPNGSSRDGAPRTVKGPFGNSRVWPSRVCILNTYRQSWSGVREASEREIERETKGKTILREREREKGCPEGCLSLWSPSRMTAGGASAEIKCIRSNELGDGTETQRRRGMEYSVVVEETRQTKRLTSHDP